MFARDAPYIRMHRSSDRFNSPLPDNTNCLVDQYLRTMQVSRQYIKGSSSPSSTTSSFSPREKVFRGYVRMCASFLISTAQQIHSTCNYEKGLSYF